MLFLIELLYNLCVFIFVLSQAFIYICSPRSPVGSSMMSPGVSPSPSLCTMSSISSAATSLSSSSSSSGGGGVGGGPSESASAPGSAADEIFRSSKHAVFSLGRMRAFYASRQLCDVTIVAGTRHFPAHRLVC